jgi:hypothetical protein
MLIYNHNLRDLVIFLVQFEKMQGAIIEVGYLVDNKSRLTDFKNLFAYTF